jgi:hypothetical protein
LWKGQLHRNFSLDESHGAIPADYSHYRTLSMPVGGVNIHKNLLTSRLPKHMANKKMRSSERLEVSILSLP